MKRFGKIAVLPLIISGLIVLGWWLLKDVQMDVLQPQGDIALQQRNLLIFTLLLGLMVIAPVFTLLAVFAVKYRDTNKKARYEPEWAHNTKLELVWWGIPILIIIVLGIVTWVTTHQLDPYKKIESDKQTVKVQVVALQWKWLFLYPDHGIATVNHMPVPEKTPITFALTADAPMSAFWVPALGSQIYSMNGMTSELNLIADRPGSYRGYTTNINGEGYASMTFTVRAQTDAAFQQWLIEAKKSAKDMDAKVYEELAKPSKQNKEATYTLKNKDFYDTIINKYMKQHHSSHSEQAGDTK